MPQGFSGITTNTSKHFLLDAGVAYINIDDSSATGLESGVTDPWAAAIAPTTTFSLGATRGGSSFNPGRTLREIPVDGSIGPVKGHIRRQESRPTLTLNLIEITVANLQRALAGNVSSTTGAFTRILGGPIGAGAYFNNVAIATTFTGNPNHPVVILIKDPIVMEAPEISFNDEDETIISVTFTGTVLASTPNTEAWAIYHPGVTP
jgi:hypothetical protein